MQNTGAEVISGTPAGRTHEKLESVQALRALAAIAVVFFHSNIFSSYQYFNQPIFEGFFDWGTHGVDLFFVISGFIMTYVHGDDLKQGKGALNFLSARISRIYGPYLPILLALICVYFAMPTLGSDAGRDPRNPETIVRSILLLPYTKGIMAVAWTLEHEIVFYGIIFIALLNRFTGLAFFVAWQIGSVAVSLIHPDSDYLKYSPLSPLEIEFIFGIASAIVVKKFRRIPIAPIISFAGILIFALEAYFGHPSEIGYERALVYGCASSLILIGCISSERRGMKVPTWLAFLGSASYSIYLIHYDFLVGAAKTAQKLHLLHVSAAIVVAFAIIAALCVACIYHVAVERPLIRAIRTFLNAVISNRRRMT